jgi:acetoin utilization protein AcuB
MTDDPKRVSRWMSKELLTTTPGAVLEDALQTMSSNRIRHLPVIDGGRIVGLLSDRDARHCVDGGDAKSAAKTPVAEVMTGADKLHLVDPSTLVREAAELLCREKISSLPVVAGDELVGIVTSEDLLWAFLDTTED